jgi:hypothetical protein
MCHSIRGGRNRLLFPGRQGFRPFSLGPALATMIESLDSKPMTSKAATLSDSHPTHRKNSFNTSGLSLVQSLFLAAFTLLFTVKYAFEPYFPSGNVLEGSYQYAFTRLLKEGKFLGVDCFFTYGPLAQYLGPVIESGQGINWLGALFKLFVILMFFACVRNLLVLSQPASLVRSAFFFVATLLFLSLCPNLQTQKDMPYNLLIFLTYLNFHWTYDGRALRNKYLYILLFLAVALLQFKFSLGLHALAVLGVISILLAFREGWKGPVFLGLGWMAGGLLLFHQLTGSWNFPRFWNLSRGITSAYSEIMARHPAAGPSGFLIYPTGLLTVLCLIGAGVLWADKYLREKSVKLSLVACLSLTGFYLFKHGFVRADEHSLWFYQTIVALIALLAGLLLVQGPFLRKEAGVAAVFLLVSLQMWSFHLRLYDGLGPWANLRQAAYECWDHEPSLTARWLSSPGPLVKSMADARVEFFSRKYPTLLPILDHLSQEKPGRTITFAPWDMMLASLLPRFTLVPAPSLQIYGSSAQPALNDLDRQFLSAPQGPEIIVLGPEAWDERNFLSDYTAWAQPLLDHYTSLGMFDGQVIFVRNEAKKPNPIGLSPTGPGLFLRLQAQPLGFFQAAVFAVGNFFFKSPEMEVVVDAVDTQGHEKRLVSRGFYSQLKQGVYLSDLLAGLVLGPEMIDRSKYHCFQEVKSAVAIRKSGIENLSTLPTIIPLNVEFCLPDNSPCKETKPFGP